MHLPKLSHKHAVTQIRKPYLADSAPAVRRTAENPQAEPTQKQLARLANATRMLLAQHQVNQAGHCRICRRSRWWRLPRRTCTIYAPFVNRTEHYLRDTNFMTLSASKIKLSTDRPQAQLRRVSPRPNRCLSFWVATKGKPRTFHHIDQVKSINSTGHKSACREPVQPPSSQVEQMSRPSRSSKFRLGRSLLRPSSTSKSSSFLSILPIQLDLEISHWPRWHREALAITERDVTLRGATTQCAGVAASWLSSGRRG